MPVMIDTRHLSDFLTCATGVVAEMQVSVDAFTGSKMRILRFVDVMPMMVFASYRIMYSWETRCGDCSCGGRGTLD